MQSLMMQFLISTKGTFTKINPVKFLIKNWASLKNPEYLQIPSAYHIINVVALRYLDNLGFTDFLFVFSIKLIGVITVYIETSWG